MAPDIPFRTCGQYMVPQKDNEAPAESDCDDDKVKDAYEGLTPP